MIPTRRLGNTGVDAGGCGEGVEGRAQGDAHPQAADQNLPIFPGRSHTNSGNIHDK